MITFVHTADTHFGVENYGKTDPTTGLNTRLLDFKINMDRIVEGAIKARVDFFILCGDAYKTSTPSPTQQKLMMECLFRLYKAGIPVIIVVGNHDHPISFGRAHAMDVFSGLPIDGFFVFSKPGILNLKTKNGPVQIVGIPWPTRNNLLALDDFRQKDSAQIVLEISSRMATIIKNFAAELDPRIPAILASHLTVSTGVFSGSEKTAIIGSDPMLMPSQLAIEPFNYVALGHLHRHQNLGTSDSTPIVYSGSIEAIDFGEIRDKKGYCLVKIDTKASSSGGFARTCEMLFIPLPTRKMLEIKMDVGVGLEQTERLARAIKENDVSGAIIKISYTLPAGAVDCVDMHHIQDLLKNCIHVVSIRGIKAEQIRQTRATSENCQDINTLLKKYLGDKNLGSRIEELLRKAETLSCCIDNKDQN